MEVVFRSESRGVFVVPYHRRPESHGRESVNSRPWDVKLKGTLFTSNRGVLIPWTPADQVSDPGTNEGTHDESLNRRPTPSNRKSESRRLPRTRNSLHPYTSEGRNYHVIPK